MRETFPSPPAQGHLPQRFDSASSFEYCMTTRTHFLRPFFFLFLLACLLMGLVGRVRVPVSAAPGDADLSLTMSVNNPTPNKTDSVIFTITVTNNSAVDAAPGVVVQDILPIGLSYVSSNGAGSYNSATGDWTVGDLSTNTSASINIVTNATTIGAKINMATITAPTDPDPSNNSASVTVTPQSADLSIAMDPPSNTTPNKTDPVIFTIRVSNIGPDTATGVTVKDLLPIGLTYVSDSGAGTYNKDTGIWTVGTVGVGGNVTLNIITNVTTVGAKTNSAEVWTSNQLDGDSTPGNGITTEDDYVISLPVTPKVADISLIKMATNSTPSIGDIVTFVIIVSNAGTSTATGVKVKDLLPSGLAYISHTGDGTYNNSTGNWSVGSLGIGATNAKAIEITTRITDANTKTNVAEVTEADQLDPDSTPANCVTTEDDYKSVTLTSPIADLAVAMGVNNATPNKADDVIFTITVINNGPDLATGVTIKDLLPTGLSHQSDDGLGTYNKDTGVWLVGSLPVGASDTLRITTRATTTGTKTNSVSILTSNQADSNTANNIASVTITPHEADLSITKVVNVNAPNPGDVVKFTITLSNANKDTATGVTVYDLLPAGYTYVSDDSGGTYDPGTSPGPNAGIWNVGSIAPNSSKVLNITTTATANSNKTNKAEVWTSDQLDPDSTPGNNSVSEDDDDAAPKVDLSLTKTVNNAVPSQGSNVVFTLKVSNIGPASATGVLVKDVLPSGFQFVSYTGAGTYDGGSGTWTAGTVAVNETKTLNITATAKTIGAYSNYAEIWFSNEFDVDSVPGNNSTTEDDDDKISISISYPPMTLLINEVAWAGTAASANDEWIELYNPGSTSVNLTGWVLKAVDGTPTINLTNGFILNPGQYYLLERTDDTTVSDIPADQIYTGELGNSSEILQLIDPLNKVVDTANSNGGIWPAGTGTCSTTGCIAYGSMERRGVMVDSDTAWITNTGVVAWGKDAGTPNDCTITPPCLTLPQTLKGTPKHANWATMVQPTPSPVPPAPTKYKTPTAAPLPPPPLVAINEFVPRPGSDWNNDGVINTSDEYIELINHGVVNVNLSGYRLDDEANIGSNPFTLPSITLKPGERIVFYGSQTGLLLSDGGDGVRLLKPNGQLADAYNYFVVEFPDQAFCRLPDNGGLDDWNTKCHPTPGLRNSLSWTILRPPTLVDEDQPLCPIADTLPQAFVLAECTPFGNNIWNRHYWDRFGRDTPPYQPKRSQ